MASADPFYFNMLQNQNFKNIFYGQPLTKLKELRMPAETDYTKEARDFVTMNKNAILSTISVDKPGYPFGSIVPYDIDNQGRIIIQVADISQHYKNLAADHRGSIIVTDQFGSHDPQAYARATLLADFSVVPNDEFEEVGWSYKGRFPESLERERAHGFLYMRGGTHRY